MTFQKEIHLVPPINKDLKFDRDQVLNRYWELATLDSDETKGNILGQLKALDSLCEELAQAEKPGVPTKPTPMPNIYQSSWMPKS